MKELKKRTHAFYMDLQLFADDIEPNEDVENAEQSQEEETDDSGFDFEFGLDEDGNLIINDDELLFKQP